MLGRRESGQYHFRLSGGFITDLHGRDMRGEDWSRIWTPEDRPKLQSALESARRRPEPLVLQAEADSDSGAGLRLEIMLTPLVGPTGVIDRMMGFYQPTSPVAALRGRPIGQLRLRAIRSASTEGAAERPSLRLAAVNGRRVD